MNFAALQTVSTLSLALCAAASVWLVLRSVRALPRLGGAEPTLTGLPVVFRIFIWPARLLAPIVRRAIPATSHRRLLSALEASELFPVVTPEIWLALRIQHGVLAGLMVMMLADANGSAGIGLMIGAAVCGYFYGAHWLRKVIAGRTQRIARDLPAYLDLLTVCVEAGATLTAGIRMVVDQAPASPLRSYFERVLREVRGGRPRAQAFTLVAELYAVESLCALASALAHAESSGMSLGQVLRAQAGQRTAERFARAEQLAMQAPVKMLGPLIFCIFPCTFIVLAVPIAYRLLEVMPK
jgi:tight adherence protein C